MALKKALGNLLNYVGDLLSTFDTTFFSFRCEMKNKIGVSYLGAEGRICQNIRNIFYEVFYIVIYV